MSDDHPKVDDVTEATLIVDSNVLKRVREAQQARQAYLVIQTGPDVGKPYRIDRDQPVVMGRSMDVEVRINDAGVSRRHARVQGDGLVVYLEDMGSANGTFLNGERLVSPRQLQEGDKITLGTATVVKFTYQDKTDIDAQRTMFDAATRDALTGAFNKKYFLTQLRQEHAFAARHGSALSLIMFDVDHFKHVNDTYGHLAGDYVLVQLSRIAQATVRSEDIFARYGGEEFSVVSRGITMMQSAAMAERLRVAIEQHPFVHNGQPLPIRISLGVAGMPDIPAPSAEGLIHAADTALYAAKHGGRNRVMLAAMQGR